MLFSQVVLKKATKHTLGLRFWPDKCSRQGPNITPPLKGGYLTPHHPPVFCAIDVIIGRYRVLIFIMSRVSIVSLCCVKFLVCVMFSLFACVVCSFSTTTRPSADGGHFAPARLASRAWSIAHCASPQASGRAVERDNAQNDGKISKVQIFVDGHACCL